MTGFEGIQRKPADHRLPGHDLFDPAIARAAQLGDTTPKSSQIFKLTKGL